jgi:holo-[acyl-carrier protein] synthase
MIIGVGTDILEIGRVSLTKAFIERILTPAEQTLLEQIAQDARKLEFLAGRFAAKEALMKALGTGIGKSSFQDFNILPAPSGQPHCDLPGINVFLSISHDGGFAIAMAVLERV